MKTVALLFLLICACDPNTNPAGWPPMIVYEGPGGELLPVWAEYPMTVEATYDTELTEAQVETALVWWNDQGLGDLFVLGSPAEVTIELGFAGATGDRAMYDPWGVADVSWSALGRITSCAITISSDVSYDEGTVASALPHEIGHCAGLEDSPYMDSVMHEPPGDELLDYQREALR